MIASYHSPIAHAIAEHNETVVEAKGGAIFWRCGDDLGIAKDPDTYVGKISMEEFARVICSYAGKGECKEANEGVLRFLRTGAFPDQQGAS